MTTVPKDDFRPLHYLFPLGTLAAAIAAVFFGTAYLWLTPPHPTEPPADLDAPAQALKVDEFSPPGNNDTAWGWSLEPPADKVAAAPVPSTSPLSKATTTEPLSNREAPAVQSTTIQATLMPPA
jgi:hypothetical protein